MDAETLHRVARERALELPSVTSGQPFGPGAEVLTVRGKMFALLADRLDGHVSLKVDPADAEVLRSTFTQVTEGYHLNKRHWVSVHPSADGARGAVDEQLLRDLVTESYLLVVLTLSRRDRPVDPDTFGRPSLREG